MAEATPNKRKSETKLAVAILVVFVAVGAYVLSGKSSNSPVADSATAQKDAEAFISFARTMNVSPQIVVDAKPNSSFPDQLLITVANHWHSQPYQMRLQMAQNLWQSWAKVHSPKDLDKARISLRDLNGNEVGGSRVFAGSVIWVQEN
jgi:hypothetical protein